jgi:hypothetical protein
MKWIIPGLLFLAGCTTVNTQAGRESHQLPSQSALQAELPAIIESSVRGPSWTSEIQKITNESRTVHQDGDSWVETLCRYEIVSKESEIAEFLIRVEEYPRLLKAVRSGALKVLEQLGGILVDTSSEEGFHERRSYLVYRIESNIGRIQFRMFPRSDDSNEMITMLEVTIRERPNP